VEIKTETGVIKSNGVGWGLDGSEGEASRIHLATLETNQTLENLGNNEKNAVH
jgi:hypothetical protein